VNRSERWEYQLLIGELRLRGGTTPAGNSFLRGGIPRKALSRRLSPRAIFMKSGGKAGKNVGGEELAARPTGRDLRGRKKLHLDLEGGVETVAT